VSGPDLVVPPQGEDAAPWSSFEGAGVVSSIADVVASPSAEHAGYALAGAGLDALGFVMDPLDALGSAGVGYLIEHLWFLHEPLDALAGDPTQITAQAGTWRNVAEELHRLAEEYRGQVGAIPGWEGDTRDAYARSAAAHAGRLDAAGDQAAELAAVVLGTGVMVATERAVLRDLIADFVWWLIELLLYWVLPALLTAGAATALMTTLAVFRALDFATDLARRIAHLLDQVGAATGTATALAARFRHLADAADRAAPGLGVRGIAVADGLERAGDAIRETVGAARELTWAPVGGPVRELGGSLDAVPAAELAELGKQGAAARAQEDPAGPGPAPSGS
jgi:hypothetical protein